MTFTNCHNSTLYYKKVVDDENLLKTFKPNYFKRDWKEWLYSKTLFSHLVASAKQQFLRAMTLYVFLTNIVSVLHFI